MPAIVVVHGKIKDPDQLKAYSEGAGPTVAAHGGEFTVRGVVLETLTANADYDRHVQITFPDADAARAWYHSDAYQALIPTRDAGADFLFTLIETA